MSQSKVSQFGALDPYMGYLDINLTIVAEAFVLKFPCPLLSLTRIEMTELPYSKICLGMLSGSGPSTSSIIIIKLR